MNSTRFVPLGKRRPGDSFLHPKLATTYNIQLLVRIDSRMRERARLAHIATKCVTWSSADLSGVKWSTACLKSSVLDALVVFAL